MSQMAKAQIELILETEIKAKKILEDAQKQADLRINQAKSDSKMALIQAEEKIHQICEQEKENALEKAIVKMKKATLIALQSDRERILDMLQTLGICIKKTEIRSIAVGAARS